MECRFVPGLYTGNSDLDSQHKKIFSKANDLLKAIKAELELDTLKKISDFFADYTIHHSSDEELYMYREGYPKLHEHKKSHEKLKEQVLAIRDKLVENTSVEDLSFVVIEFVVDYLIEHIKTEDMEYIDFLRIRSQMDNML